MKLKYVMVVLILLGFMSIASAGISYDAPFNQITITGYTEITPCTFNDLYNADVSGGWGVITKQGDNQFYITTRICFGNGLTQTWFADSGKHIVINAPSYPYYWGYRIRIRDNAFVRLGTLISEINKSSCDGCCVKLHQNCGGGVGFIVGDQNIYDKQTGTLELYSSQFLSEFNEEIYIYSLYNTKIYNCIFAKNILLNRLYNSSIDSVSISDSRFSVVMVTGNLSNIKNSEIWGYGIHYNNKILADVVMEKCEFINCSKLCEMQGIGFSLYSLYLIDVISNTWEIDYYHSSASRLYRQYSFNLETSPNAKITIMDHTDIVYQGYAYNNGTIDEQILTMGYYTLLTGSTLNSQNPYRLEISKPGYQTYSNRFNLTEPIIWNIGLEPERIPLDKSGIVTGLGFLIGCMIVSIGLIIMKRREFL